MNRISVSPAFSKSWITESEEVWGKKLVSHLLVATNVIYAVRGALLADPALDHGPEVMTVVEVESAPLAGLETHLPNPHLVIPKQETGAEVGGLPPRALGQLAGKIIGPIPAPFSINFYHTGKASFPARP